MVKIVAAFFIVALGVSLTTDANAEEPSNKFLGSMLMVRPGILDLGEMTVQQYVEGLRKVSLNDGSHPKVIGWSRKNNEYKLRLKFKDQPAVLTFIHDLSAGSKGAVSLLLPVSMAGERVDALMFTMLFMSGSDSESTSDSEQTQAPERSESEEGPHSRGSSSDHPVPPTMDSNDEASPQSELPNSPTSVPQETAEAKKRCKKRKGVWHQWDDGRGICETTVHMRQPKF